MNALKNEEHYQLTDQVKKFLFQNRVVTVIDFLEEDVEKLPTITKLSLEQVLDLRNHFLKKYAAPLHIGFKLHSKILTKKKLLKTFIVSLDLLLNGGLPVGYITEICGLADSGKTQLCLQIGLNCAKQNEVVLYIDTKGDFSAVRIQKILDLCAYTHKDMALIMFNIKIIHIWNLDELVEMLKRMKEKILVFSNLSLIIIDSLPSLMLQFLGDDNKIGLTLLNNVVNHLRYLAKELEIAVVCVNIQTRWVNMDATDENEGQSYGEIVYVETKNRCLGKYWHHIPVALLILEKQASDSNQLSTHINVTLARLFNLRNKHCLIEINNMGSK